ncbi:hypothetical protein JCM3774_006658 [Rhodotorula dairenensis]
MCELKPLHDKTYLRWATCSAYKSHNEPPLSLIPSGFMITPSAWFRQAEADDSHSIADLVLASNPAHFPSIYPVFYPEVPENEGAMIQSFNECLPNGWLISYRAKRLDMISELPTPPQPVWLSDGTCRSSVISVPSYCKVFSLKMPLLDLFQPRDASPDCPW